MYVCIVDGLIEFIVLLSLTGCESSTKLLLYTEYMTLVVDYTIFRNSIAF